MGTVTSRPLAVVTGASAGIGLELAQQCVQHDFDLIICAQDDQGIAEAARHLSATGASVVPVAADLATYGGVEQLYSVITETGRPIDALLLNAGIGVGGAFLNNDLEDELRVIALNCASVVHLAKRVIPHMVNRRQGRVLITASVASPNPAPYLAVYGATKAFDLMFAEALRNELQDTGVTVTALQPGATDTEFFERADMENTKVAQGKKDAPEDVARAGFEAMMKGKDKVIAASLKSKIQGIAGELLPETAKAALQATQTKPGSAKKH
ncbi:MAG: SDR family NAD(P)-dependent oxidoreductase [Myxococcota bacterium]|nr:SDR family NAD(P)-dependent oxidoreductase [Myxococcota bacterium]